MKCCTQCDFVTKFKSNLNRHIKFKHNNQEVITATKKIDNKQSPLPIIPKTIKPTKTKAKTNDNSQKSGYIYLCIPENCQLYNQTVYKIGMTIQHPSSVINRILSYGPNTEILSIEKVKDQNLTFYAEELILRKFRKEFKLAKGNEYFYGDPDRMSDIIMETIKLLREDKYDKYDYQAFNKHYTDPLNVFGFGICVLIGYVDYKALRDSMRHIRETNKSKKQKKPSKKLVCSNCKMDFAYKSSLKRHIDEGRCRGVESKQCRYCKKMLASLQSRYNHERRCKIDALVVLPSQTTSATNYCSNDTIQELLAKLADAFAQQAQQAQQAQNTSTSTSTLPLNPINIT